LNLLERHAKFLSQFFLGHFDHHAPRAQSVAEIFIDYYLSKGRAGRGWIAAPKNKSAAVSQLFHLKHRQGVSWR
jgi:hypothetical protein